MGTSGGWQGYRIHCRGFPEGVPCQNIFSGELSHSMTLVEQAALDAEWRQIQDKWYCPGCATTADVRQQPPMSAEQRKEVR